MIDGESKNLQEATILHLTHKNSCLFRFPRGILCAIDRRLSSEALEKIIYIFPLPVILSLQYEYLLNLNILISSGIETNTDFLSNGE